MRISLLIFCFAMLMSCNNKKKEYAPINKNIPQNEVLVKEVQQTSGYTYVLVQESGEEFWMAISKIEVSAGEKLYFIEAMEMKDFESKELNKVFDRIIFADQVSNK